MPAGVVGKAAVGGECIAGDETREEDGDSVTEDPERDEPVAESGEAKGAQGLALNSSDVHS